MYRLRHVGLHKPVYLSLIWNPISQDNGKWESEWNNAAPVLLYTSVRVQGQIMPHFGVPQFLAVAAVKDRDRTLVPLNAAADTWGLGEAPTWTGGATTVDRCSPVFLVHDITGDVNKFVPLATALDSVPCFGLQLQATAPVHTLEALADYYLCAVAARCHSNLHSPQHVVLGGYSLGVRIACQMAATADSHGLVVTRLICAEEGPSSPQVQLSASLSARYLLGGLGFILDLAPSNQTIVAEGLRRMASASATEVACWLTALPVAALSPAVRAIMGQPDWYHNKTLMNAVCLRIWFAQQAAQGSLLLYQAEPTSLAAPILLLRVDSVRRAVFMRDICALMGHSPITALPVEPWDYGLAAIFPAASQICVVEVPGDHGTIWAKGHISSVLIPAVLSFLALTDKPAL